jgi:hypothetical protein
VIRSHANLGRGTGRPGDPVGSVDFLVGLKERDLYGVEFVVSESDLRVPARSGVVTLLRAHSAKRDRPSAEEA